MLLSLLFSGAEFKEIIIQLLLTLPVIILALVIHETAHGYVAYKCGDRTAYNLGRLTLNPIKHLDPVGFLCMMAFGYGWAKPVPINTRNFNNPKRGMAITAAAGPGANLILGVVSAVLYGASRSWYIYSLYTSDNEIFLFVIQLLMTLLYLSSAYNFLFMAFNLIPVPPFDGSRIALAFLPAKVYFGIMKYEQQIMIGLLLVIFLLSRLGFSPFSWVANQLTYLIADPVADLVLQALI